MGARELAPVELGVALSIYNDERIRLSEGKSTG